LPTKPWAQARGEPPPSSQLGLRSAGRRSLGKRGGPTKDGSGKNLGLPCRGGEPSSGDGSRLTVPGGGPRTAKEQASFSGGRRFCPRGGRAFRRGGGPRALTNGTTRADPQQFRGPFGKPPDRGGRNRAPQVGPRSKPRFRSTPAPTPDGKPKVGGGWAGGPRVPFGPWGAEGWAAGESPWIFLPPTKRPPRFAKGFWAERKGSGPIRGFSASTRGIQEGHSGQGAGARGRQAEWRPALFPPNGPGSKRFVFVCSSGHGGGDRGADRSGGMRRLGKGTFNALHSKKLPVPRGTEKRNYLTPPGHRGARQTGGRGGPGAARPGVR